jgi:hypothetical protein
MKCPDCRQATHQGSCDTTGKSNGETNRGVGCRRGADTGRDIRRQPDEQTDHYRKRSDHQSAQRYDRVIRGITELASPPQLTHKAYEKLLDYIDANFDAWPEDPYGEEDPETEGNDP